MKTAALFLALCFSLSAEVKLTKNENSIAVEIDGQPFTTFYYGPETMKPYLHPLRSASGKIVTRRWPQEQIPGETKDHPHHTGLWFTHGDVNGLDFWANLKKGPKTGEVRLDKISKVKSGGKSGVIEADFNWVNPEGKTIMKEHRVMTFYSDPKNREIDLDLTLKAVEPIKFGDTKEGTFAIRLADALAEKGGTGTMTSSAKGVKMKAIWGKPAAWVDYAGTVEGEPLGVAIFDHPANPRHPSTWHARDYGLFAANIFGVHDFLNDKTKDGSLSIEAGKTVRFRYRVLVHPGLTADAPIGAAFDKYAK